MQYITDSQIEALTTACCGVKYMRYKGWCCSFCGVNLTEDLLAVDKLLSRQVPVWPKYGECKQCLRNYQKANSPLCPICRFEKDTVNKNIAGKKFYTTTVRYAICQAKKLLKLSRRYKYVKSVEEPQPKLPS